MIFIMSACGEKHKSLIDEDIVKDTSVIDFSEKVHTQSLELLQFRENPDGFSIVGSQADKDKLKYLSDRFTEIGLSNVHTVEIPMDGWSYKGLTIQFECECSDSGIMTLYSFGAYPYNFEYKDSVYQLVNVGEGTLEDLNNCGNLYNKGVVFKSSSDLVNKINNAISKEVAFIIYTDSENIYPSSYRVDMNLVSENNFDKNIPIFVISSATYSSITKGIPTYSSRYITMNGSSELIENTSGEFLIGEIQGSHKNKYIYITANRDTIEQGFLSSCQSVSELLTMAEVLSKENYVPKYTLRFMITTGTEWGSLSNEVNVGISRYLSGNNDKIQSVLVLDGSKALKDTVFLETQVSKELKENVEKFNSKYTNTIIKNTVTDLDGNINTEASIWSTQGIPTIRLGDNFASFYVDIRNSSYDTASLGTDANVVNFVIDYYTRLIKSLS